MKKKKYVILINRERVINGNSEVWFYVGTTDHDGEELPKINRYSSLVIDAKTFETKEDAEAELDNIPNEYLCTITTISRCPKCTLHYAGYPAISRRDNKTEICPKCGMAEAMEDLKKAMKGEK